MRHTQIWICLACPEKEHTALFHIFNLKDSFYYSDGSYGIQLRIFLQIYNFWLELQRNIKNN